MSGHIDVVKRAIEFKHPDYLPMQIVDVPGIYNAYHTLDPDTVEFIPGTESFDSMWTNNYSWFHEPVGKSSNGETIKEDQFGVVLKTPLDENSAYVLLKHPLAGKNSLAGYEFPDPDDTDPYYERLGKVIRERYADRFVDGFIDAGSFLTAQLLFGMEEFLLQAAANIDLVTEAYEKVTEYYKALIPKYKKAGAHMITMIEDVGGTNSLVINPRTWRERFRPITESFLKAVHDENMYAGLAIDGHSADVLDDLLEMPIDVFSVFDIKTTGLNKICEKLKGRLCVKATVDMQSTLATGAPEEVEKEAAELVETLNRPAGGFICQVVRWHRPEYPAANVLAQVRAFNKYRPGPPGA